MSAQSVVYVIGDPATDGPVKIGTTRQLTTRLASIRSGDVVTPKGVNLRAVEVLYTHPGGRPLERRLHVHYARWRLVGEWFDMDPEGAAQLVYSYLDDSSTVEAVAARGVDCSCHVCRFLHPHDGRPGDRPEFQNPSIELLAAVNSITYARLGVNLSDDHVGLPASHCDLDRALRLVEILESNRRYAR